MKKKVFNTIGILLIIIGVVILSSTIYMKYTAYKRQAQLRQAFENSLNIEDNNDKSENQNKESDLKSKNDSVKAIGILIIPKIDLNVAIGEGVDDEILKYAVAHFPETAMPGQAGNCCIAGHRNFTYAEYFKNLDKLSKGDEIIIKTKDKEYTYLVTESFIVDPEQVEVLEPTKEPTITLVTCTVGAKQRLIVKGILKQ